MRKTILLTMFMSTVCAVIAQKDMDKEAIKAMCGCHSVKFDYAETFSSDTTYELYDQYHASAPAEWIFVDEETEDKIVIQHILVINDTIIIKHWRQDWIYQNQDLFRFTGERNWKHVQLSTSEIIGQWTQSVYQVDDSPRYQGTATWVHVDGKHFWENTTDAPLPRREYTKRSDYNIMQRTNKHILTDNGWMHEQDNLKIARDIENETIIVAEKGWNAYTKIDDSRCEAGKKWWEENKVYWRLVRAEWDKLFAQKQDIYIEKKIDNKMMWQVLFELGTEMEQKSISKPEKVSKEIAAIIDSFLELTAETDSVE